MGESKEKIHVIVTGGTIDSIWDAKKDMVVLSNASVIPAFFENIKILVPVEFTEVCLKDSRALNDQDREKILETLEKTESTQILITHGRYTVPDTIKYLQQKLTRKDQVILFTSSVVPIFGFDFSDGPFNIGYAVAKLQDLTPGMYFAMKGKCLSADEIFKQIEKGEFYHGFTDPSAVGVEKTENQL